MLEEGKPGDFEYNRDKIFIISYIDRMIPKNRYIEEDTRTALVTHITEKARIWRKADIESDAYIKKVKLTENCEAGEFKIADSGRFKLEYLRFGKWEIGDNGYFMAPWCHVQLPAPKIFAEDIDYPCIGERNEDGLYDTWMSVSPSEMETMASHIGSANGKVLTLGLGMGYYAYHAHLKDNVESVTIAEREQDVIDLFEKYILPQFDHPDKIKIIKSDAIEYIENLPDGEYDHIFADIWISCLDIEPYMELKYAARKFKKTKIEYWIEDALAAAFITVIYFDLMKEYVKMANRHLSALFGRMEIPDLEVSERALAGTGINIDIGRMARYIKKLYKDKYLEKPADIDRVLDPKYIAKEIGKSKIRYRDI